MLQVVAREHAATPPQRRALEGWSSARHFDGPIERSANDPTRAGRHCAVAAASPDPCVGPRSETVGARSAEQRSWVCCAARPEWPLASRDGRLAKDDGPGNSAGTVALEPLRRGTAAIAFRRADRHLGEIGLRCAAAKQARRQSALCRTSSAAVYSDARSAGMVLISTTNLVTLPAPPSACCCVCRLQSPLCAACSAFAAAVALLVHCRSSV